MASLKAIKRRRKVTQNTYKIVKTMGLVATAKLKMANQKFQASQAYRAKAYEMLAEVLDADASHPLLLKQEKVSRIMLIVITSNRGLCGSYNTRLLDTLIKFRQEVEEQGKKMALYVAGRKGIQYAKFHNIPVTQTYPRLPDQPALEDLNGIGSLALELFTKGEVNEVWVLSMYKTRPEKTLLLPFALPKVSSKQQEQYYYWPDAKAILAQLLPHCVKMKIWELFMRAAINEQTSRMLAMKLATENADKMIKLLTRSYNRARQTQITREILDIVGGASAIK